MLAAPQPPDLVALLALFMCWPSIGAMLPRVGMPNVTLWLLTGGERCGAVDRWSQSVVVNCGRGWWGGGVVGLDVIFWFGNGGRGGRKSGEMGSPVFRLLGRIYGAVSAPPFSARRSGVVSREFGSGVTRMYGSDSGNAITTGKYLGRYLAALGSGVNKPQFHYFSLFS